MPNTILQINYQFTSSPAEHRALVTPAADPIAATPGLVWKVWLINETDHEAGGIYLFESRDAAQGYLNSPIITGFAAHPSIRAVSAKLFDTNESLSRITRAPLPIDTSA